MHEAVKLLIQKGIWVDGHNDHLLLVDIDRVNDAYFTNIVKYALTKHEARDEFTIDMFEKVSKERQRLQNERKNNDNKQCKARPNKANNGKSKKMDGRKKVISKRPAKRTDTKPTRRTDRVQQSDNRRGEDRRSMRHERVQPKLSGKVRPRNGSRPNGQSTGSKQGVFKSRKK